MERVWLMCVLYQLLKIPSFWDFHFSVIQFVSRWFLLSSEKNLGVQLHFLRRLYPELCFCVLFRRRVKTYANQQQYHSENQAMVEYGVICGFCIEYVLQLISDTFGKTWIIYTFPGRCCQKSAPSTPPKKRRIGHLEQKFSGKQ